MNEKFFDLPQEKQDRMINGALELFAINGYRHASTDDMVKATGVSKGLWFHYFCSKEGLYIFVYHYCVKYMLLELSDMEDKGEQDYFRQLREISFIRARVYRNYPYMMPFFEQAAHEPEKAIAAKIADTRRAYEERIDRLLGTAKIRSMPEGEKQDRLKRMLDYTISGIFWEYGRKKADFEALSGEIRACIDLAEDMTQNLSSTH